VCKKLEWWSNLELVVQLLQPISDAIHTLEADAPLLGQVRKVMHADMCSMCMIDDHLWASTWQICVADFGKLQQVLAH